MISCCAGTHDNFLLPLIFLLRYAPFNATFQLSALLCFSTPQLFPTATLLSIRVMIIILQIWHYIDTTLRLTAKLRGWSHMSVRISIKVVPNYSIVTVTDFNHWITLINSIILIIFFKLIKSFDIVSSIIRICPDTTYTISAWHRLLINP